MITLSKSKLKARMLEYFRLVEETGEELLITSHRKPVIRIARVDHVHTVQDAFGDVRGAVELDDSIMTPESDDWEEL